jgi:hypothetical protein
MDKSEAQKILREQMARIGNRSHSELTSLVEAGHIELYKIHGERGTVYQVEIQFFWDDQPGNTIRIMGSVDDGGVRAVLPLTDSVLIARPSV